MGTPFQLLLTASLRIIDGMTERRISVVAQGHLTGLNLDA
jgi:hypothetical protein